ncbi:hypothetical protein Desor_4418 [Desulfosporosinus orientis DSM 765]|uniref:Uncharacterized protein n=1 Tax=Desulfosporosinus orientis (strain ATCC 19365 / DSM 765 / NCIMB 8382 / VKM B-1628 / Singapore I) TaxID=768706 RepID=G7W6X9_DESOD|nr:helix-turn-helix transcriptional regulator [Desulfosporosinus orientis]AET69836.1 hypothetical protein Desor_4418 [Desulfosporosinus orientis DSM 765]
MNQSEFIENLKRIAEGIAKTFGNNCEVLVADLDNPENAILDIQNGQVTGRKKGDSLSELGLHNIKTERTDTDLFSYSAKTGDGRLIKCTTVHLKWGKGNLALGINYDCTNIQMAVSSLESLIKIDFEINDEFHSNSNEMLDNLLADAFKLVEKPVSLMTKEDRIKIVRFLDERGALLIQKGVQIIAEKLNVSRYTIYNYLNEINNKNKKPTYME